MVILVLAHFATFILNASTFDECRLLGTPNEEVWPGVSKLVNWHEYPQWSPKPLSSAVPGLDENGLHLLSVSYRVFV